LSSQNHYLIKQFEKKKKKKILPSASYKGGGVRENK
jgi:hypothetical protein